MAVIFEPNLGGFTPHCNDCGVALCWDISPQDYAEAKAFWDAWTCQTCNGGVPLSRRAWMETIHA